MVLFIGCIYWCQQQNSTVNSFKYKNFLPNTIQITDRNYIMESRRSKTIATRRGIIQLGNIILNNAVIFMALQKPVNAADKIFFTPGDTLVEY